MHEITGDLFESELADAICITTNGFTNAQGANTMGRGCAGEAKYRWPGIQMLAGAALKHGGNDCRILTKACGPEYEGFICLPPVASWQARVVPYHILMFPTKPDYCVLEDLLPQYAAMTGLGGEPYPGWMAKSDLSLIERSAKQLCELTDQNDWKSVVLPRPGCGAGELSWEREVRPLLAGILDQRFYAITFAR